MSKNIRKTNSKFDNLKKFCYEQLWVLALFAPLVVIVVLITQNVPHNNKQTVKVKKNRSIAAVAIEITSVELAVIIAKPLSELLLIEVYFAGKNKIRHKTVALGPDTENTFSNQEYSEALADQAGHEGKAEIAFSQTSISLNNKKIGEHS